jgi:hypothetical protein
MTAIAWVISLLAGAIGALGSPPADLAAAIARADGHELARLGRALGAAGLAAALAGDDRAAARGAIVAIEAAEDAATALPGLRRWAAGADRPLAAAAARAAARIAVGIDALAAAEADAVEALGDEASAWRVLAQDPGRYADVRVAALEVAARLARATGTTTPISLALAADPDPELRRAALELVPIPAPADTLQGLAGVVGGDPSDEVAIAAAQALCGGLAPAARGRARGALGAKGLARLARLVDDRALAAPARADAAGCLEAAPR